MTPEPERVIEDGVAWVAFAYYEELVAERDALAARLRDAESVTFSGTVTRLLQRAEAAEARLAEAERDAFDRGYEEGVAYNRGGREAAEAERDAAERAHTRALSRAVHAERRVAALTEALRTITAGESPAFRLPNNEWAERYERHEQVARAALAAADRPEGTTGETWFAGTPPHLRPNGGSCTCGNTYRGDGTDLGRSRCPIHGREGTP